jgi:hypothetical protein
MVPVPLELGLRIAIVAPSILFLVSVLWSGLLRSNLEKGLRNEFQKNEEVLR